MLDASTVRDKISRSPAEDALASLRDLIEVGAVGGLLIDVASHCGALLRAHAELVPGDVIVYGSTDLAIVEAVVNGVPQLRCYRRRADEMHEVGIGPGLASLDTGLGVLRFGGAA